MHLQPGDTFYWIKLQSLDDWQSTSRIIWRSVFAIWYEPTNMIISTKGQYFRPNQIYSTQEDAIAAALCWIEEQREILREIEAELHSLRNL